MDEPEHIPNGGSLLGTRARAKRPSLGPALFAALAFVCAVGSLVTGGYFSLGRDGLQQLIDNRMAAAKDPSVKPTHEWIALEKTIYQLSRREDAKYVLAEFTVRVPIDKAEHVRRNLPEVEFALQTYIRELSSRELQGAMGLYNLRNASLFRARRILGRDAVEDILIGELLVE
jgi:hypothetical protein